jgi:sugar lactone lactonase YvrE
MRHEIINIGRAFALAAAIVLAGAAAPAEAQFKSWVLAELPDTPEGLGMAPDGTIYAALFHTGEIIRINDDGSYDHMAWVPSQEDGPGGDLIGLDTDRDGVIYVAYKSHSAYDNLFDPFHPHCKDPKAVKSGVYKVDPTTGEVTALATKEHGWPFCFPDDVEIDGDGNVYLTDLTYAGIWKVSPDGKQVDLWSSHQALNWADDAMQEIGGEALFTPLGVNVLVLDPEEKHLYAGMTGDGTVYRFPINEDGSAGEPILVSDGHSAIDGIELDEAGNIYLSEILRNEIVVIAPDGSQRRVIADAGNTPLDSNTSLIYKDGTLCTANLGFGHPDWRDADRTVVCIAGFEKPTR